MVVVCRCRLLLFSPIDLSAKPTHPPTHCLIKKIYLSQQVGHLLKTTTAVVVVVVVVVVARLGKIPVFESFHKDAREAYTVSIFSVVGGVVVAVAVAVVVAVAATVGADAAVGVAAVVVAAAVGDAIIVMVVTVVMVVLCWRWCCYRWWWHC